MLPDPNVPEEVEETQSIADWISDYIPAGTNPIEPISDLLYPVFEEGADDIVLSESALNSNNTKPVAIMGVTFYWRDLLKLTEGVSAVAVFENDCNPTFTYQIDGANATYLGRGDFHDPKYDSMKRTSSLSNLQDYMAHASRYTGIPLNTQYCPFTVSIYPSSKMESFYLTKTPAILTASAVLIACFISFIL